MQNKFKRPLITCLGLLFIFSACAGLKQQVAVSSVQGVNMITMEADSFKFTPNYIKAYRGDEKVIKIVNIADAGLVFVSRETTLPD